MKVNQTARIYRNPIYLAKEYKQMIDNGDVKTQAQLTRLKGISRARVTQILRLLKLDSLMIQRLEKLASKRLSLSTFLYCNICSSLL